MSGEESPHATVEVGVFGGEGVRETAQDVCEELNGVSVGRTGPRILYMVSVCMYMLEGRKKEASKVKHTTRQNNTTHPKQSHVVPPEAAHFS